MEGIMQNPEWMVQNKHDVPTLHISFSQITHGWSKKLVLSKLGMFLYALKQKASLDVPQIVGKCLQQGWREKNTLKISHLNHPTFSIE